MQNAYVENNMDQFRPHTNLIKLSLMMNKLTSSVLVGMNNFSSLTNLQLSNNNFIGQFPLKICQSGTLVYFGATNNQFTGPIPKSLKNCRSLFQVWLDGN